MDPVSAIASIVGIVGFGIRIQIAQILQKEIDAIQTATERVEQILIEIRATATGLTNLQELLLQDHGASLDERIFSDEGRVDVAHIVRRCNTVFRNITVLVAKAGHSMLSSVDQFQRQVEEEHEKTKGLEDSNVEFEIELSNLECLMWPWRLPKIRAVHCRPGSIETFPRTHLISGKPSQDQEAEEDQKQVCTLNRLHPMANTCSVSSDTESEKWEGSQAETLVQDEIFYQDKGLRDAEKSYEAITTRVLPKDRVTRSAQVLIASWPDSPSGRYVLCKQCSRFLFHGCGCA